MSTSSVSGEKGFAWSSSTRRIPVTASLACAEALATQHEGLIHELKQSGLSLHYRARPELGETVRESLISALANAHDGNGRGMLDLFAAEDFPFDEALGE